ncbi:MAG: hypothetical protein ABI550_02480 [Ignavibacteriaceae bacterium]
MRLDHQRFMKLYKNKFRVDSTKLKDWDYSTPAWYYVTTCLTVGKFVQRIKCIVLAKLKIVK